MVLIPLPRFLGALFFILFTSHSFAETITVAVAANFTAPMKRIAVQFELHSGHKVNLTFGSTGSFYAQIHHGAPYAILFSADQTTPTLLVKNGGALLESQFTYAIGTLVLWSAKPNFVDAQGDILHSGKYGRLALANPQLAPYGAAAMQVIDGMGLRENVRAKIIQGENITQAYQFVATGNADFGFLALAQVLESGQLKSGSVWRVPPHLYTPIRQDAVLLRKGGGSVAAKQFLQYVRADQNARAIILAYGYELPANSP